MSATFLSMAKPRLSIFMIRRNLCFGEGVSLLFSFPVKGVKIYRTTICFSQFPHSFMNLISLNAWRFEGQLPILLERQPSFFGARGRVGLVTGEPPRRGHWAPDPDVAAFPTDPSMGFGGQSPRAFIGHYRRSLVTWHPVDLSLSLLPAFRPATRVPAAGSAHSSSLPSVSPDGPRRIRAELGASLPLQRSRKDVLWSWRGYRRQGLIYLTP